MAKHDWDSIAEELESARAAGKGEWSLIAEEEGHYALPHRLTTGDVQALAHMDLEVETRPVGHESELFGRAWDVYARLRA